jgi:hypothetical protein
MRRTSLMDSFLEALDTQSSSPWFQKNLRLFLAACDAHGETAIQHHEQLVKKFIEDPAFNKGLMEKQDMTASGPPLPVLLRSLRKLCDMRCAADRDDIPTRYADVQRLRNSLTQD